MKMMMVRIYSTGWWSWLTDWTVVVVVVRNDLSLIRNQINDLHYDEETTNHSISGPRSQDLLRISNLLLLFIYMLLAQNMISYYNDRRSPPARFECEASALIIECRDRSSLTRMFSLDRSPSWSLIQYSSREWFTSLCAGWLADRYSVNKSNTLNNRVIVVIIPICASQHTHTLQSRWSLIWRGDHPHRGAAVAGNSSSERILCGGWRRVFWWWCRGEF